MAREILINPPRLIALDQRVKFGAVQALTGMAEAAFNDLKELTYQLVSHRTKTTPSLLNHHRALGLAWSIVDQADLLRHLILSEKGMIDIPEKRQFLIAADEVQKVRNWMRHIPQRVSAYKSIKKPTPPVLGALSFTTVVRAHVDLDPGTVVQGRDVIEYHTIVLINTACERKARLEGAPVAYDSFRIPVDHFVLQAFGILLPLGTIVKLMTDFCDALAVEVRKWFDATLLELRSNGTDVAELIKPAYDVARTYRMIAKRD